MEFGSDFDIDLKKIKAKENNIFKYLKNYDSLYFDSGRNAIRFLLEKNPASFVALPAYICESVTDLFKDKKTFFYKINDDFSIDLKSLENLDFEKLDIFYLMNYFGFLQSEEIREFLIKKKEKYNFIIIEDTTHSIFSSLKTIGDFCVCSLRKWFPVPDGGVLYSQNLLDRSGYCSLNTKESGRINAMVLKSLYLRGNFDCKETFRKIFLKTEEEFEESEIKKISDLSKFLLGCFDVDIIKQKRLENYKRLESIISKFLPPVTDTIKSGEIPFTYVTALKDRDKFRKYLIENKVYCAVHWPMPECIKDKNAKEMSGTVISVPTDQRYGLKDMDTVAKIIGGYFNE